MNHFIAKTMPTITTTQNKAMNNMPNPIMGIHPQSVIRSIIILAVIGHLPIGKIPFHSSSANLALARLTGSVFVVLRTNAQRAQANTEGLRKVFPPGTG